MKRSNEIILFIIFTTLANAFLTPSRVTLAIPYKNCVLEEKECIRSNTQHEMSSIPATPLRKPERIRGISSDIEFHTTSSTLDGFSCQNSKKVVQRDRDLLLSYKSLDELEDLNVVQYASFINELANMGDATKAEKILNHMLETSSMTNVIPNSYCFSGVMKAHIRSFRNKPPRSIDGLSASEKCNALLDQMNELYRNTSQDEYRPNTVIYNTLLKAYAEEMSALVCKPSKYTVEPTYEAILHRDLKRKGEMYNLQKQIVSKAVGVVKMMEDGDGIIIPNPDVYTYCTIISLLAKCEDVEIAALAESYLPMVHEKFDTPTYNAVISAWASTGTLEGAMRATALLEDMERAIEDYIEGDSSSDLPNNFGPNSVTYFTVISAWVKCCRIGDNGFAAEKAESVLNKMVTKYKSSRFREKDREYRFKPNVIAYSSIIDCWSKSGCGDAASHAKSSCKV
jgi:hypothetical protein